MTLTCLLANVDPLLDAVDDEKAHSCPCNHCQSTTEKSGKCV